MKKLQSLIDPDPRWSRMYACIKPIKDQPTLLDIQIEVYYAARPWFVRTKLDIYGFANPWDVLAIHLDDMIQEMDLLIQDHLGRNAAMQYDLVPENYEELRRNGLNTKTIEALERRDKEWNVKTVVLVLDPVDRTRPVSMYSRGSSETHELVAALARQRDMYRSGVSIDEIMTIVDNLTHPNVVEKIQALLKTIKE